MGVLTQKERDGLEDVFLSIHSQKYKVTGFKQIATLLINQAKLGLKENKLSLFFHHYAKKKKNLSK